MVLAAGLLTVEEDGLDLGLRPSSTKLGRLAVGEPLLVEMEEQDKLIRAGVRGKPLNGEKSFRGEVRCLVGDR